MSPVSSLAPCKWWTVWNPLSLGYESGFMTLLHAQEWLRMQLYKLCAAGWPQAKYASARMTTAFKMQCDREWKCMCTNIQSFELKQIIEKAAWKYIRNWRDFKATNRNPPKSNYTGIQFLEPRKWHWQWNLFYRLHTWIDWLKILFPSPPWHQDYSRDVPDVIAHNETYIYILIVDSQVG